ncbi:hypothetical protein PF011_g30537 [Phytophthora fragariae]|uniref:DDE Tnp4 domain-containing protein n=1 Tax=Phytophthora fragariae TaxID=53985 RepID=A0A6A3GNN6_9STRA|nr:hypothetical protein PF011_g30537 [Phytophthora fragariae]
MDVAVHARQRQELPKRDESNQGYVQPASWKVRRLLLDPRSTFAGPSAKFRYLHQVLGMLLCFYVGSMKKKTLCMLFGVPPATLARTLRKAEDALSVALQGYAPARIAFPSPSQQAKLAKLVEAREPLLKYTFGFIDGKNLRVSG